MTAKNYLKVYLEFRDRYKECIRMLNGLEKTLERKIPAREQRWQVAEEPVVFDSSDEMLPHGCLWSRDNFKSECSCLSFINSDTSEH